MMTPRKPKKMRRGKIRRKMKKQMEGSSDVAKKTVKSRYSRLEEKKDEAKKEIGKRTLGTKRISRKERKALSEGGGPKNVRRLPVSKEKMSSKMAKRKVKRIGDTQKRILRRKIN